MTPAEPTTRPRVEGDREQEVLEAALDVLADVGYDRLTMDSVAQRAKASKATLYRRWTSKSALVIDALLAQKPLPPTPDTGTLRGDLLASYCGTGGLTDHQQTAVFASVLTAVSRDTEFAEAFRRDVIGPKIAAGRALFDRAQERGEISPDVDVDLLAPALAGTVLHRMFLLGEQPSVQMVTRVVDEVILPAALRGRATPGSTPGTTPGTTPDTTPDTTGPVSDDTTRPATTPAPPTSQKERS